MSHDASSERVVDGGRSGVQPLVVMAIAFSAGVFVDRYAVLPLTAWLLLSVISLSAWLIAHHYHRTASAALLLILAGVGIGGARHHDYWRLFSDDELGRAARDASQPVCLEAIALTSPARIPAPPEDPMHVVPVGDRSLLSVRVTSVRNTRRWEPASGDAQLSVDGHLLGVKAGDRIRVLATFVKPQPRMNPGEFDMEEHARTKRQLFQLHVSSPDAVTVVDRAGAGNIRRIVADFRSRCQAMLWSHLRQRQAAIASAVLLGAREQLDWERTQAFVTTGTVHLLAISGLHVGILAYGFWWLTRLFPISRRTAIYAAAAFVILYAGLTSPRPPVIRATILIVAFCIARLSGRRTAGYNVLAAAALVLLVWNPANLFLPGTQLSFLAVATVFFLSPYLASTASDDPLDKLIARSRPWFVRWWRHIRSSIGGVVVISAAIWLVALPLTMYRYHLFSPIAVVLNPIVWIPIAAALLSGFGVLLFGWLAPPVAYACGGICNFSLGIVESIIEFACGIGWGHFWTPGPDLWWVVGFYAGLALYPGFLRRRMSIRWCIAGLAMWVAVGVLAGSRRSELYFANDEPRLDCTFQAVGHGGCAVLELPDGRVVMYDAGRMGLPGRAVRAISAALWSRGITHLDAIVISHADADHFNAVPDLLQRFSVGAVYVSPVMFEQDDPASAALRQAIDDAGIPIRLLHCGSRLDEVDGKTIRVLHPPPHGCDGGDNANSIVLRVEYGGRCIILPGDLEEQGLRDVLAQPSTPCDVLLVPHHGSTRSSPAEIAGWCTPRWAVISASVNETAGPVEAVYRDSGATVLHTAISGAVRVRMSPEDLTVRAWREQPW